MLDGRCQMSDFRRREQAARPTITGHSERSEESFPIGKFPRQDLSTALKVTSQLKVTELLSY